MHDTVALDDTVILLWAALLLLVLCGLQMLRLVNRSRRAEQRAVVLAQKAGALNDRLLQSLHGFLLVCHVAAQSMQCEPRLKRALEAAVAAAEEAARAGSLSSTS